jgi:hypothetical protein
MDRFGPQMDPNFFPLTVYFVSPVYLGTKDGFNQDGTASLASGTGVVPG